MTMSSAVHARPFDSRKNLLAEIDIEILEEKWRTLHSGGEEALAEMLRDICGYCLHMHYGNLETVELYIALSHNSHSQEMNHSYRGKNKPTNILSFPGVAPEEIENALQAASAGGPPVILGDMLVAFDVLEAEAKEQGKSILQHLQHLIVHGTLHLLGYDHIEEEDAEDMEALERQILAAFGIADPYKDMPDTDIP